MYIDSNVFPGVSFPDTHSVCKIPMQPNIYMVFHK